MTDLKLQNLEQMRRQGKENFNRHIEEDKRRQTYLKEQDERLKKGGENDFRRLYRDKGSKNTERVNSVISYEGAVDDLRQVYNIFERRLTKEELYLIENMLGNNVSAFQIREMASYLESIVENVIKFVHEKHKKSGTKLGVHNYSLKYNTDK